MKEMTEYPIRIVGARTHNLKNISVEIPRNQVVVITGRSGSGKSSLAIDTLSAEGQRQYLESLSLYSRQFLKQLPAPDCDMIEGLPPTICLDQGYGIRNRRSTVGTCTEIYDYLRLLMARCGEIQCYQCHRSIRQHTVDQICRIVMALPERTKIMILAPLVDDSPGDHSDVFKFVRRERLVRLRINGRVYDIDQLPELPVDDPHSIAAVTDRIIVRDDCYSRLHEAVELAQRIAGGRVSVASLSPDQSLGESKESWFDQTFCTRYACPHCNIEYEEVQPGSFSFNSLAGACPTCQGLGELVDTDAESAISVEGSDASTNNRNSREKRSRGKRADDGEDLLELPELDGARFVPRECPDCEGTRLSSFARSVFVSGRHMGQILKFSIEQGLRFFGEVRLPESAEKVAAPIIKEIFTRLRFLDDVGLGYLSLSRSINSLSGGEHQRVRLATSIGSGLSNVGYILDEPSIGLHPRDTQKLIDSIHELKRLGNTMVIVEHDESTIRQADYVIDMGPGAGVHGGEVIACGTPRQIEMIPQSLTGEYLSHRKCIPKKANERVFNKDRVIILQGATGHNLKQVDIAVPLDMLVAVTGVSGSGKSTLVNQTLVPGIRTALCRKRGEPLTASCRALPFSGLEGADKIKRLVVVDQRPIGASARGCPATVTGLMDPLRKIFSATRKAKQLGFGVARFSFNSKTGWCPDCRGRGTRTVAMNFIPDIEVKCDTCHGRRYNFQSLQVKFNDQSIADILDMSAERAVQFFDGFEEIRQPLQTMCDIGLGYLTLGQPTNTLSGGESQRLKLATELISCVEGGTLYVLDEPTTGLHFEDIRVLMEALNRLMDAGNSMLVIEHDLDLIRSADWIIDLGPEGGQGGGEVIATGPLAEIVRNQRSHTGRFLA